MPGEGLDELTGGNEPRKLAGRYTRRAVHVLVGIMENEEAKDADRRGAARDLLELAHGKIGSGADTVVNVDNRTQTHVSVTSEVLKLLTTEQLLALKGLAESGGGNDTGL